MKLKKKKLGLFNVQALVPSTLHPPPSILDFT
jgi:hypothetical protein